MSWPQKTPTLEAAAVYRARVRGCLLGGAVGDALGYPIEFLPLERIRTVHGERGVTVIFGEFAYEGLHCCSEAGIPVRRECSQNARTGCDRADRSYDGRLLLVRRSTAQEPFGRSCLYGLFPVVYEDHRGTDCSNSQNYFFLLTLPII